VIVVGGDRTFGRPIGAVDIALAACCLLRGPSGFLGYAHWTLLDQTWLEESTLRYRDASILVEAALGLKKLEIYDFEEDQKHLEIVAGAIVARTQGMWLAVVLKMEYCNNLAWVEAVLHNSQAHAVEIVGELVKFAFRCCSFVAIVAVEELG